MHELSVCQGMLNQVSKIASEHNASAVDRIVLSVGALSGVEPSLLQRAYSVAKLDTIAEHAELEIRVGAVCVSCRVCGKESEVDGYRLLCGHCQSWQVNLTAGEELLLLQLELSGLPDTPADDLSDEQSDGLQQTDGLHTAGH